MEKLLIILTILIIALVVLVIFLFRQNRQQKSKESQQQAYISELETELTDEKLNTTQTLEKLNNVPNTDLGNTRGNIDYFAKEAEELFAADPSAKHTLVTFSIHNIGKINQLFGPTEGDKVVSHATTVLTNYGEREHFIYAQVNSNLFCLMIPSQSKEVILKHVEEMTKALQKYSQNFTVLSAFGLYEILDSSKPLTEMINACMLAQKFVKDPVKCNYMVYSEELETTFQENKRMSQEMAAALEAHKFLMYLQPIVDLHTFRIVGAETLVRWDYPGKGILSPYTFIPLFESTNLVQKLDYYMWEECLKTIRRWIDNHIEPTPLAMNISPIHMQNTNFIKHLDGLCDHYLIDKSLLILEIPERAFAGDNEYVKEVTQQLKEHGYYITIDNFGSMNSPLNLLHDYPVDAIKLDRSFLIQNGNSENGISVLRYLVAMAKDVGVRVTAEGIEDLEQANLLSEIGSDAAQGYFFSKPLPVREFDTLNHSMIKRIYQANEYYPTFEDLEKDIDLLTFMLEQEL